MLLKVLSRIKREETLPNPFSLPIITARKTGKDTAKKGSCKLLPLVNVDKKILHNIDTSTSNSGTSKYHTEDRGFLLGMQDTQGNERSLSHE